MVDKNIYHEEISIYTRIGFHYWIDYEFMQQRSVSCDVRSAG